MRAGLALIGLLSFAAIFGGATAATPPWREYRDCTLVSGEFQDGDSFHARVGATNYIFRLAYVDAPETDNRYPERLKEQATHFGIPREQVNNAGRLSAAATRELLARPFTIWTRWSSAQGTSSKPRYYAVVILADGRDLGEVLLEQGWARAKGRLFIRPDGTKTVPYSERLKKLEATARRTRQGLWNDDWFKQPPATQAAQE